MADAVTTTTTTAKALKQYWHDFFIDNLEDIVVMRNLTKRAKVPTGNGKVVWWVGLQKGNAGAAPTEGADPTARSSVATRVSATLAECVKLVKNSRLFSDTSIDGFREEIIRDLARDAALQLDTLIMTQAVGGSNRVFAASKVHRSDLVKASTATIDDVRNAVRVLQLSSVPTYPDGYYVGVVHPDVAYDLMTDSKWVDVSKYRDTVKYDLKGEIGSLYGVRFMMAPTLPILTNTGSAKVDVYRTLVMGPGFLGQSELGDLEVVINEPGKNTELNMFNTYGYRFVQATARIHEAHCVRIESSAKKGSNG